ncbi:MAG TPA: hypothetical protein DDX54_03545 [Rhodospirillaceae bacterium]|jgi:protein-disulfide isomerase|nr:DsbA family protein [Alphaproteobacteria bacterium]HBH26458.1 hypothetical protein [Rhodospirillaceae bacterium]
MRTLALMAILLAVAMPALAALTPEDRAEVAGIVAAYIRDNPDKVMQALQDGQGKILQAQQAKAEARIAEHMGALTGPDVPAVGNLTNPDMVVVEAFDYNCIHCHRAMESVRALLVADPGVQVRFVDMPMLAASSNLAARWALASDAQGQYWNFHQALMTHKGQIDERVLEAAARALGLDIGRLRADADGSEVAARLARIADVVGDIGLQGVPTFIVGGRLYAGYLSAAELKAAVARARAEASEAQ